MIVSKAVTEADILLHYEALADAGFTTLKASGMPDILVEQVACSEKFRHKGHDVSLMLYRTLYEGSEGTYWFGGHRCQVDSADVDIIYDTGEFFEAPYFTDDDLEDYFPLVEDMFLKGVLDPEKCVKARAVVLRAIDHYLAEEVVGLVPSSTTLTRQN